MQPSFCATKSLCYSPLRGAPVPPSFLCYQAFVLLAASRRSCATKFLCHEYQTTRPPLHCIIIRNLVVQTTRQPVAQTGRQTDWVNLVRTLIGGANFSGLMLLVLSSLFLFLWAASVLSRPCLSLAPPPQLLTILRLLPGLCVCFVVLFPHISCRHFRCSPVVHADWSAGRLAVFWLTPRSSPATGRLTSVGPCCPAFSVPACPILLLPLLLLVHLWSGVSRTPDRFPLLPASLLCLVCLLASVGCDYDFDQTCAFSMFSKGREEKGREWKTKAKAKGRERREGGRTKRSKRTTGKNQRSNDN